jgi:hypothetical protein
MSKKKELDSIFAPDSKKVDTLLHYDMSFRNDWRFLSRLRILVGGVYIGIATTIFGWIVGNNIGSDARTPFIIGHVILSFIAISTMAWFGSSLNVLKNLIVRIEEGLELFKSGSYLPKKSILSEKNKKWGKRRFWRWGTSVIATIFLASIFLLAIWLVRFKPSL